jgi:hypothetical protein
MAGQSSNIQRGTPGRLLLLWAALMPAVVLFAWQVKANRKQFDWIEYPTGLGDQQYYISFGNNDFYEPNLHIHGQGQAPADGLYRRMVNPVERSDEAMQKLAKEQEGRCFIYAEGDGRPAKRLFVKSGEDRYIEFGQRKFWPEFKPKDLP